MSKNIVIQEGGAASTFNLDKLKPNGDGHGENWMPEDGCTLADIKVKSCGTYNASDFDVYGIASIYVDIKKNGGNPTSQTATPPAITQTHVPSIKEGGIARYFSANRLRVALDGGGFCDFVPEAEVALTTKSITQNKKTFKAQKDGYFGYSSVVVSGITITTGRDSDGNETYTETDSDGTRTIVMPSSIKIEHMPDFTGPYNDGEVINYEGLMVKAYKADGSLWTDSKHPDGYIQIHELILPETYADASKSKDHYWETNAQIYVDGVLASNGLYYEMRELGSDGYDSNDQRFPVAVVARENFPGGFWSIYWNARPFLVAHEPAGGYLCASAYSDAGHGAKASGIGVSSTWSNSRGKSYTYDGKTVYWFANGDYVQEAISSYIRESDIRNRERTAWAMVYGGIPVKSGQIIPVQWSRIGDGDVLETSFSIDISSADE